MADKRISELPLRTDLSGDEEIPVALNGQNYKITPNQITKKVEDAQANFITGKQAAQKYYPKTDGEALEHLVDILDKGLGEVEKDLADNYARKDGAYEGLLAGTALNLQGQDVVANSSMYRTAGGDADIATGLAEVVSVRGESRAWNQLVKNGNFKDGTSNVVNMDNANVEVSNGVLTFSKNPERSNCRVCLDIANGIFSHTYFLKCKAKVSADQLNISAYIEGNTTSKNSMHLKSTSFQDYKTIVTPFSEVKSYLSRMYFTLLQDDVTASISDVMAFDLTLIYGAGNEPSTPEEFEADYQRWFGKALSYEEYDEGSLRPVLATGIETVGFNLSPISEYEGPLKGWNEPDLSTHTRRKLFVNDCGYKGQIHIQFDVVANDSPTLETLIEVWYRDGSKRYFGNIQGTGHIEALTDANKEVDYILGCYGQTSNANVHFTNICINFSWSGKRNGDYEPHWEETKPLPITSLTGKLNGEGESVAVFPDGMKRAGDVYDEIVVENGVTKAIKRVGQIDLSEIGWLYVATSEGSSCKSDIFISKQGEMPEDMQGVTMPRDIPNCLCAIYDAATQDSVWRGGVNKVVSIREEYIRIVDSAYTDTAAFKEGMQGVLLYYELAEPETYILDNFTLPIAYKVDDFGTEKVLSPEGSVAPALMTRYGINAVDTLRRLPQTYISSQSIDNFLAKLSAVMNGSWSKSWNESTNSYDFSFVANVADENPPQAESPETDSQPSILE